MLICPPIRNVLYLFVILYAQAPCILETLSQKFFYKTKQTSMSDICN